MSKGLKRGKSKWQRSAALRSPLASAVGAQRSPASACRAWAAAFAECQGGGSTQVLWRSARLRLVSCRVQTRCDLLFGSLLLDTHHAFTTPLLLYLLHPNSIRYLHTPPQHNLSLITHRVIHRLRVLHRHGVSAGASPGSLLASGGPCKSSAGSLPADAKWTKSQSCDSFSLSEPLRQCR